MKIGIIGAMHEEIVELKTSMTDINEIEISNLKFYEGKLCSKDVILVESGIGKVNAAISTTLLISNFKVDKIIFTGVAGAVNPDIKVTDIVIATDLVESDMDVTAGGNYKLGEIIKDYPSFFANKERREKLIKENAPQVVACGVLFCVRRMNVTFKYKGRSIRICLSTSSLNHRTLFL